MGAPPTRPSADGNHQRGKRALDGFARHGGFLVLAIDALTVLEVVTVRARGPGAALGSHRARGAWIVTEDISGLDVTKPVRRRLRPGTSRPRMFWPFLLIAEFWKAERERRARIRRSVRPAAASTAARDEGSGGRRANSIWRVVHPLAMSSPLSRDRTLEAMGGPSPQDLSDSMTEAERGLMGMAVQFEEDAEDDDEQGASFKSADDGRRSLRRVLTRSHSGRYESTSSGDVDEREKIDDDLLGDIGLSDFMLLAYTVSNIYQRHKVLAREPPSWTTRRWWATTRPYCSSPSRCTRARCWCWPST